MCKEVGVVKRLDLESISKDIADLVKQLDKEVEGGHSVQELKRIDSKVQQLIES